MGRKTKSRTKVDCVDQQLTSNLISDSSWCIPQLVNQSTRSLIISLLIIYYFIYLGNYTLIVSLLSNCIGLIVGRESCSIVVSPSLSKLFHLPVNCSKCSTINQIIEVTNITSEQFESRFAYTMEPLIIRGAIKSDWKALDVFSLNFFKQLYLSTNNSEHNQYRCQFFPYLTPYKTLTQALQSINDQVNYNQSTPPWYIGWSNCDPRITSILRQFYSKPKFLPINSEDSRLDWIFMGTPGYGAPMHIDNVGYPSWQAQIKGTKMWILEPPLDCYLNCKRFEVTINPGDIIVLDTNQWFHETQIIGNELSITIGSEYD